MDIYAAACNMTREREDRALVRAQRERCAQRLCKAADEVDKTSRHGTLAASILRAEAEAIEREGHSE